MKFTAKGAAPQLSALAIAISMANTPVYADIMLEEVLVTAQKREQSMQDVPIAMDAMTSQQMTDNAVKDIFDMQSTMPSFRSSSSQSSSTTYLDVRAIGTSGTNFGLEQSVGIYVDGIYRARASSMINNMVDLEAAEVLKGPQGTLFGKNTPAGAVLFRTKAPSYEQDGFIEATVGNYNLYTISGASNVTLMEDELAMRVTGFTSERDGVVDVDLRDTSLSDFDDSGTLNDRNRWGARVQFLYTPSEEFSARISLDYSKINEKCCAAMTSVSSLYALDRTNPDGSPILGSDAILASLGGTVYSGDQYFNYQTAQNKLPVSQNEDQGISVELEYEFSDALSLTSITSYRQFDSYDAIDVDFSDVALLQNYTDMKSEYWSQELRVNYSTEDLNVVGGFYFFDQTMDMEYELRTGSQSQPYFDPVVRNSISAVNPAFLDLLDGINLVDQLTAGTPLDPLANPVGASIARGATGNNVNRQDQTSYALFAQMDYNISEALVLTAGVRYTQEKKDLTAEFTQAEVLAGNPFDMANIGAASVNLGTVSALLGAGDFAGAGALMSSAEYQMALAPYTTDNWGAYLFDPLAPRSDIDTGFDDGNFSGALKLSYFVNDDAMIYGSVSTGYKSGVTNTDRIGEQFDVLFDAETTTNYEIGAKIDIPSIAARLNAAAFYTIVDEWQTNTFVGDGFLLQNAGKLKSTGVELDYTMAFSESLVWNLNYMYNQATFDEFDNGPCWVAYPFHTGMPDPGANGDGSCNRTGDTIGLASEHNVATSLRKDFTISNDIDFWVSATYVYSSDAPGDNTNDPYKDFKPVNLVNVGAGLVFNSADVQVLFWGRNVADNDGYRGFFDVPVQDGRVAAYPMEPRTFGLTVTKNF